MKKPELQITKTKPTRLGEVPTEGTCTSCPDVRIQADYADASYDEQLRALREGFKLHFKTVHMREDASQAAARIVREATNRE